MGIQRIQAQCGVCPLKGLQGHAYIRNNTFFAGGIHTTESHSAALEETHHAQTPPCHHLQKQDHLPKDAELLQQQNTACPCSLRSSTDPGPTVGFFSVRPTHSAEARAVPAGAVCEPSSGALPSFTLTSMQRLHVKAFSLHKPVIFLLAYRIAACNIINHRNNSIRGACKYVQD